MPTFTNNMLSAAFTWFVQKNLLLLSLLPLIKIKEICP
ncbi:hypothetical protein ERO13_D11G339240v2 [Gossypium hirsutum]|uniref:Uncharacterized protein n=1 Tax=Gossypium tomentosum TaxID=34277 RepID=A0A5D2IZ37_GOSTO|nr:hypothetical protein ERO13_D11G339240v2 [Gossypium hirsutum]TYH47325.1 hypothetical protein ES332_D11G403800v1 [Gossypium tomentosum]